MCGVAGAWRLPADAPTELLRAHVDAMTSAIAHRGPDDASAWLDAETGIALGHRRLSILDLSTAGRQPMLSRDARWVLAFNGEIYGYAALRDAVEAAGGPVAWRGHADTEVLVEAIARFGVVEAARRANGMFAFAAWDRSNRTLWLARDRVGEKPMYYGWSGSTLLFGSELRALQAHPAFRCVPDRAAITSYLRYGYVPGPSSAWQGTRAVPPGKVLEFRAVPGADPTEHPYWDAFAVAKAGIGTPFRGDDTEAADALEALLRDAVRQQMSADVPLGAFLSGGIDSSLIVALMQAAHSRPVRTFTVAFDDPRWDESRHAAAIAAYLGTDHTELRVTPADAIATVPELAAWWDEPFADASAVPTALIARLTSEHVTVALSGDGGDELFGGYDRYRIGPSLWRRMAPIPATIRRGIAALVRAVPASVWQRLAPLGGRMLPTSIRRADLESIAWRIPPLLEAPTGEALYGALVSLDPTPATSTGSPEARSILADPAAWPDLPSLEERLMAADLVSYLPDDILVKLDRATMRASLEGRIPLLDPRVIAFAWSLPLEQKLRGGVGKRVLRDVLSRYVPRPLFERPKMGFSIPLEDWLRGPLASFVGDLLRGRPRVVEEGFVPTATLTAVLRDLDDGRQRGPRVWSLLMLEAWLRRPSSAFRP